MPTSARRAVCSSRMYPHNRRPRSACLILGGKKISIQSVSLSVMVMPQITTPHMEPNRALARLLTLTYTLLPKSNPNTQIWKMNAELTRLAPIMFMASVAVTSGDAMKSRDPGSDVQSVEATV